jgi:hypothetical protein
VGPNSSLPWSQDPAISPYPQPDESSRLYPILFLLKSILFLAFHLRLDFSSGHFSSVFPTKTLYAYLVFHMRATCSTDLILVDLFIVILFGKDYML